MIQLKNLQKYYNKGRQNEIHVINDITLDLPDTGLVAVFGPSGCGKTTLLNVIGGLDTVGSGEILINDSEMSSKNAESEVLRNRDIGVIFQNYNLNRKANVFDNVADSLRLCGVRDEAVIAERVEAALANVGLEKFVKRLPDMLSGGQQQRVAIARAIVKNPKVILADEPTGNLDEANTILVMDILKAMSKERLVLIVTHEAELVDYYCDMVIELKDGCVVNVRTNETAQGYVARNKNDIYLGELTEHELNDDNTDLTFFGEAPDEPIKIMVVNHNGRLFLKINTPKVTLLDETSEVNLKEGVYEEALAKQEQEESVDMSKLPPIEGKDYGKLFRFRKTLHDGYYENFKGMMQRKSKKRLALCLALFGAAFVFIAAMFGRGIGQVLKAKEKYNDRILYVAALTDDVAPVLRELADDPSACIDYWGVGRELFTNPTDPSVVFNMPKFVTSGYYDEGLDSVLSVNLTMPILPESLIGDARVVKGGGVPIQRDGVVLTTKAAKLLLRKSPLKYINSYEMLLGMVVRCPESGMYDYHTVVGIVESDELAAYVSEESMALIQMKLRGYCDDVTYDMTGHLGVEQGECIIVIGGSYSIPSDMYDWEDVTMTIDGQTEIEYYPAYVYPEDEEKAKDPEDDSVPDWMQGENYFYGDANRPDMPREGDVVYYNGIQLKVKEVKKLLADKPHPTIEDYHMEIGAIDSYLPTVRYTYEDEMGRPEVYNMGFVYSSQVAVILNKKDYFEGARTVGKTTRMLDPMSTYMGSATETAPGEYDELGQSMFSYMSEMPLLYYVIHSTDPKVTSKRLEEAFSGLEAPYREMYYNGGEEERVYSTRAYYTSSDRFNAHIQVDGKQMPKLLIIGGALLFFLCMCMYFIMKSNIINRIREVGIYRAIGVTKKNMRFRFALETGVVVTFSVMAGYLFASIIIRYVLHATALAENLFYYPIWFALIVLAFLYVVCIICGMIPLLRLLRRTPAEILAKYDI